MLGEFDHYYPLIVCLTVWLFTVSSNERYVRETGNESSCNKWLVFQLCLCYCCNATELQFYLIKINLSLGFLSEFGSPTRHSPSHATPYFSSTFWRHFMSTCEHQAWCSISWVGKKHLCNKTEFMSLATFVIIQKRSVDKASFCFLKTLANSSKAVLLTHTGHYELQSSFSQCSFPCAKGWFLYRLINAFPMILKNYFRKWQNVVRTQCFAFTSFVSGLLSCGCNFNKLKNDLQLKSSAGCDRASLQFSIAWTSSRSMYRKWSNKRRGSLLNFKGLRGLGV